MDTFSARRVRVPKTKSERKGFLSKLWGYASNTVFVFVLVFIIVFLLNMLSERSGSIVKISEGPRAPSFTGKKVNGLPVMRLELGKRIDYDLNWYYLEGGCDTKVHLEFEQDTPNIEKDAKSTVGIDLKGRSFAVGAPGLDHVSRPQPIGLAPGLWKYTSTLTGVCANGRKPPPEKMAEFYLEVVDPKQPAFKMIPPFELLTPSVKATDHLRWRYGIVRDLEGPAVILYTLLSKNVGNTKPDDVDLYMIQRTAGLKQGAYPNLDVDFDLPDSIHPGTWGLSVTTVTNLPNGRIQTDTLFDTTFEVTQ